MKINELRELSNEDLKKKIDETKAELFNLRFSQATGSLEKPARINEQATGSLEKPARINELRKAVARMKTILRERELQD